MPLPSWLRRQARKQRSLMLGIRAEQSTQGDDPAVIHGICSMATETQMQDSFLTHQRSCQPLVIFQVL